MRLALLLRIGTIRIVLITLLNLAPVYLISRPLMSSMGLAHLVRIGTIRMDLFHKLRPL